MTDLALRFVHLLLFYCSQILNLLGCSFVEASYHVFLISFRSRLVSVVLFPHLHGVLAGVRLLLTGLISLEPNFGQNICY